MEQKISLNSNRYKQANRESAIELLKIIAVLLIIIRHVIQTLFYENSFISYHEYVLDLSIATTKIQMLVLSVLAYVEHGEMTFSLFVQHGFSFKAKK